REAVQTRLEAWLKMHIVNVLLPLVSLRDATDVEGLARGVAFRLVEHLGSLPREHISEDVRALDQAARGQLRKYGVRFGAYSVFMPALLKPAPARLLLTLWTLTRKDAEDPFAGLPAPPAPGLTSVPADAATPPEFYAALGFRVCGARAVRLDMLERVADLIRPVIAARSYNGGFVVTPDMMSLVGCSGEEFAGLLRGLGYRSQVEKVTPPRPEEKKPQEAKPEAVAPESSAPEPATDDAPAEPAELAATECPGEAPAPKAPVETTVEAAPVEATPPEPVQEPAPGDDGPAAAAPEIADPQPAATPARAEETPEETPEAEPDAAAGAPVDMEIWRPVRRKHTGRPRSHQKRTGQDNDGQKKPHSGKHRHDDGRERPAGKPPRRGPRIDKPASVNHKPREREPDPDSPFAALAVLKERARGN
ncbi:MAG: disulfide oxidoreductase, partial [Alphaproteobacteria bacterium HGW-Alphaproteobacteria-12]